MDWLSFSTELILGAILGTLLSFLLPALYHRLRDARQRRRVLKRQTLLSDAKRVYDWLLAYYERHDALSDLYECTIGHYTTRIPFLTTLDWQQTFPIPIDGDVLLAYSEGSQQAFETDARLIQRRQALGQRLFNAQALYLDRIEQSGRGLRLHVKSCDYFEIATSMMGLEEETFRAVKRGRFKRTPLRNAYIATLEQARHLYRKPFAIGCAVALALKTEHSYELLIHTRSHSTVTFGGLKALTPNFGLAPVRGMSRDLRLAGIATGDEKTGPMNLLFYNTAKEYLEELFDYEQLIEQMNERRANALWFFDLPEGRQFMTMALEGQLRLEYLGFGFDALNGNTIIGLLGVIDSIEASLHLKQHLKMNWEFADKQGRLDINAVDIQSPLLEDWLRDNRYHTGAAFTLSKALDRLIPDSASSD